MPKNKKEPAEKKEVGTQNTAAREEEQVFEKQPSRDGQISPVVGYQQQQQEKHTEPKRYASITGDTTPPREDEISHQH